MGTHPKIIQKKSSCHWQKSSSSAESCSTDLPFQVKDGNTEHSKEFLLRGHLTGVRIACGANHPF